MLMSVRSFIRLFGLSVSRALKFSAVSQLFLSVSHTYSCCRSTKYLFSCFLTFSCAQHPTPLGAPAMGQHVLWRGQHVSGSQSWLLSPH